MGKLVIEGNKVYSVDEACMKRKKLTLEQIRQMESERRYTPQTDGKTPVKS